MTWKLEFDERTEGLVLLGDLLIWQGETTLRAWDLATRSEQWSRPHPRRGKLLGHIGQDVLVYRQYFESPRDRSRCRDRIWALDAAGQELWSREYHLYEGKEQLGRYNHEVVGDAHLLAWRGSERVVTELNPASYSIQHRLELPEGWAMSRVGGGLTPRQAYARQPERDLWRAWLPGRPFEALPVVPSPLGGFPGGIGAPWGTRLFGYRVEGGGGVVLWGEGDSRILELRDADGQVRWRRHSAGEIACVDDHIYITQPRGLAVYALEDGHLLGVYPAPSRFVRWKVHHRWAVAIRTKHPAAFVMPRHSLVTAPDLPAIRRLEEPRTHQTRVLSETGFWLAPTDLKVEVARREPRPEGDRFSFLPEYCLWSGLHCDLDDPLDPEEAPLADLLLDLDQWRWLPRRPGELARWRAWTERRGVDRASCGRTAPVEALRDPELLAAMYERAAEDEMREHRPFLQRLHHELVRGVDLHAADLECLRERLLRDYQDNLGAWRDKAPRHQLEHGHLGDEPIRSEKCLDDHLARVLQAMGVPRPAAGQVRVEKERREVPTGEPADPVGRPTPRRTEFPPTGLPESADTPTKLVVWLNKQGQSEAAAAIWTAAAPALVPALEVRPDAEIPVGTSKVGGDPDLSAPEAWPRGPAGLLAFLFQVELASLAGEPLVRAWLPAEGVLSFFFDPAAGAPSGLRILHQPSRLARVSGRGAPRLVEDTARIRWTTRSQLMGALHPTFPAHPALPRHILFDAGLLDPRFSLLGPVVPVQPGSPLERLARSAGEDPGAWMLLGEYGPAFDPVEGGSIFMGIRREDLLNQRFHDVRCLLQSLD